jgi:hypothetical protein
MPTVHFTKALERHVTCPSAAVGGATVHEVLDGYFALNPAVRGYVLDEQGALRRHVTVFVGDAQLVDRTTMSDAVAGGDEIYVMQALSGG